MTRYALILALAGTVTGSVAATSLPAQASRAGGRQAQPPRQQQRELLERRLQARIDSIVRDRLALTDEQFVKIREVATRIERERRQLRQDDSETRIELRRELAAPAPNEEKVAELLDRMPRIERRRIDLHEREQRELSRFLTPSQRARYFALQDELRRNMQEMQRRRLGLDDPNAGPPGPGRGGGGRGRVPPP